MFEFRMWRKLGLMLALGLAAMLLVVACSDDDGDGEGNGGGGGGTVRIAQIPGWPDSVATSNLWKVLLEERGYTVEITPLDVAPAFAGLAGGDLDVYTSSWLPGTHGEYMNQFGDDLEQLDPWYGPAGLYLSVPSYVEVDSLADLPDNAELFDSTIVGIEAGAGMMGILARDVMPAYGLDDWTLIESSTGAMLAELQASISRQEPVLVTLWSPGWWYGEMDLKNLEDPENAWGDPDELIPVTRAGFADDFPEVAEWMRNWEMSDEQYAPLEKLVTDNEGNEEQVTRDWVEDNRDIVDPWFE